MIGLPPRSTLPMTRGDIPSRAFYAAELHSERVRIFGVLAFLAIVTAVLTVRVFLLHTTVLSNHVVWNLSLAAALVLYECAMLRLVDRALATEREFPRILWFTSTILETAVPAIGVAWLTTTDFASAYRPLASPATLLFSFSLFFRFCVSIPGSAASRVLLPRPAISPPPFILAGFPPLPATLRRSRKPT